MSGSERPTGTVTFLFTDIEGSTKLWEAHPRVMRVSLSRHDGLMRRAIDAAGGHVFKTMGDGFCAAFGASADAISAALNAQIAVTAEHWPEETPIKVRIALHTGAVESRDEDYFGQPLSRTARLLSTGHGGQVLVSQTTYDLARDQLPASAILREMGEHRLRDLGRPENVFQLIHPDLPTEFPPLRSLDNPELKHNLPQQVTSFVGREKEIAEVRSLMSRARLITLTGSGGSGKTRLSLQVAADLLDESNDGVWIVELAPLSDAALVSQTVANVLGIKEEPGHPIAQTLVRQLKAKRLMLILDSCEHVLDACARLADTLIHQCPKVQILASSREAMGISGELTYRVPSLSSPDPKRDRTAESLSHFEAVQLFIERAQFHRPAFAVNNQNAPALASICFRLDGIPLAIELAAARVRSLSVEEIDSKLDQRFQLLTGGSRTSLPRQQTLRSLIDWSYDLLNEQEKLLLQRLSVFAGGWTLEAAENVCSADPVAELQILDLLTSLSDKSLVVSEQKGGQSRYRLLETVRQYAGDRLAESGPGGLAGVNQRHGKFFLNLAWEVESQLSSGDQAAAISRFEADHDNFRLAIQWNLREGSPQDALALGGALGRYWDTHGHLTEGRKWLDQVLESAEEAPSRLRAEGLRWLGALACNQADYQLSSQCLDAALGLFLELGDKPSVASTLVHLGLLALDQAKFEDAKKLFEEADGISSSIGDLQGQAICLGNLGAIETSLGNGERAFQLLAQAVEILRASNNRQDCASALNNLGNACYARADFDGALALYAEALGIYEGLGDRKGLAVTLGNLGTVALGQRNLDEARTYHRRSLALARELSDRRTMATALNNLGDVAFALGDSTDSECLHEEALEITRSLGDRHEIAVALNNLGAIACAHGDSDLAVRRFVESSRLFLEIEDNAGLASALAELANALLLAHRQRLSAQALGIVATLLGEDGITFSAADLAELEAVASTVIDGIGPEEFSIAYQEGEEFSPQKMLEMIEEEVLNGF